MRLLDKMERKYRKFAIKDMMIYIAGLNLAVYLLALFNTKVDLTERLMMNSELVLKGEVWRLITFIFVPPNTHIFFILFALYFYYMMGQSLEHQWGSFKFNVYYLIGIVGTIIAAFISRQYTTAVYLNLSLFLAFAYMFPNYQILLFFIIPMKVKYLGWLDAAFLAYAFIIGDLGAKLAIVASILNFILFFGKDIISGLKLSGHSYTRKKKHSFKVIRTGAFHRCTICGRTELDDRSLEFRYCINCSGDHEYCMEHLHTHEHIKQ